jgi:hypothetical protein
MPPAWPVSEPAEVHLTSGTAQLWIDLRGGGLVVLPPGAAWSGTWILAWTAGR